MVTTFLPVHCWRLLPRWRLLPCHGKGGGVYCGFPDKGARHMTPSRAGQQRVLLLLGSGDSDWNVY